MFLEWPHAASRRARAVVRRPPQPPPPPHTCTHYIIQDNGLTDLGECPYDQGGYFVINGSEKVIVAQERMSSNHVYVFPGQVDRVEIRSVQENSNRPAGQLKIELVSPPKGSPIAGKVSAFWG